MSGTIYIVGSASHWEETPWGEKDAEYWGMNTMYRSQPLEEFTSWFELHDLQTMYVDYPGHDDDEHLAWLGQDHDGIPIYAWEEQLEKWYISQGVPFPKHRILDYFYPWRYFTNSVTWLLGHAITQKPDKIGLYGVDMATSKEHRRERPSVEWLLGWAMGAGIEIEMPPSSDLLHVGYLYGAEQANDITEKVRAYIAELGDREDRYLALAQKYRRRADQMIGAKDTLDYIMYAWLEKPIDDGERPSKDRSSD